MNDAQILAARGPKLPVDPWKPYAFLVEPERTAAGIVEEVATILLTNRECPFRCLFCDLWKHTLDEPTPLGAIPAQIDFALARLPPARHIKLYNSGNFFDPQAIPPADWPAIVERVRGFRTVIVENHPRLINERCVRFRDLLAGPELEVALGLETIEPQALAAYNKQMTLADFTRAAQFLTSHQIAVRTFLLLQPPFVAPEQATEWAIRGIEFAFEAGARCVSIIPTRSGDGVLRQVAEQGTLPPPRLEMLEEVVAAGVQMNRGRVWGDLWDVQRLAACPRCGPARIERLQQMNLTQTVAAPVDCDCNRTGAHRNALSAL